MDDARAVSRPSTRADARAAFTRAARIFALCAAALLAAASAAPAARAGDLSADEIARRLMMQRAAPAAPSAASSARPAEALRGRGPALEAAGAVDLEILFASGSAALSGPARRQLAVLCSALRADLAAGAARWQIVGHTDAAGDSRENLILSQSRAESVAAWLAGPDCGLDRRRLTPVGMGEERLKLPHAPRAAANRRVEIQSLS